MSDLICYFDASYDNPKTLTIVSGWVATTHAWERFETDWRILLAKYDVPYFHMTEFAHSKGPFEKWKGLENKRANFIRYMVDIIGTYALNGFACLVNHKTFAGVDANYCLSESMGNPYAFAGRDCIAHANMWLLKEQRGLDIKYVFEDGDEGKGALLQIIERDHQVKANFVPSQESGAMPLQAADFAAYELLKAIRDLGENAPLWKYRKSLQALSKIPAWWGQYTEDDLLTFCENAKIPLRA